MSEKYEALRKALDAMAPCGSFHKSKSAVQIDETEDWPNIRVDVLANKLVAPVVARYITEAEPGTIRALLADHARLQAQVEQLRTEAKVASDRIQELGWFTKAQRGEIEGLRADLSRAECNRDMWEEQCARQAEQLETGILRLNAEQAQVEGLRAVRVALDRLVAHIGMDGEIDANHPAVHEALNALNAIDSARAGREGVDG